MNLRGRCCTGLLGIILLSCCVKPVIDVSDFFSLIIVAEISI